MENIRQAIERAKVGDAPAEEDDALNVSLSRRPVVSPTLTPPVERLKPRGRESELSKTQLQANRIIAHDIADPRAKAFDMLRTQILRTMDLKGWQVLAITSATPACGKTLTAINLAISMARHQERSVPLVDLALRKPQIANCLGLDCDEGLLSVLDGRARLGNAVVEAKLGSHRFMVLPTERSAPGSAELMASRAMAGMLQQIRRDYPARTVILDLPPLLSSDDVIALLPQIDCALLVAAVGTTTIKEIEECNRHLQSTNVVRVVLNKVPHAAKPAYY